MTDLIKKLYHLFGYNYEKLTGWNKVSKKNVG